ncbi:hypothetical protein [Clostridium ganghwense]|uniref:Uncharacterized protein n=1 Tax=Clostridium ganghwense TaxID=312089 RepID=A0ABT4CNJ0_9CLOT|nr:hypothetical protein [Clostridium ganghwense]MCY6370629.1 hypothetical protein [Clostridium ganghwense]
MFNKIKHIYYKFIFWFGIIFFGVISNVISLIHCIYYKDFSIMKLSIIASIFGVIMWYLLFKVVTYANDKSVFLRKKISDEEKKNKKK